MFDLISIGTALVDNYYFIDDAELHCRANHHECEICLRYGDKVPAAKYSQQVGGNNANNAVGSSRLGIKTAFYAHVGDDPNGQHIIDVLKKEKVDTRYIQKTPNMSTENSAVINFQGERTILVFHQPWEYDLPELERTKWVYFSSVAESFSKTQLVAQVERYIERTGSKLAFSPGTHQLKFGVKKFPKLLSLTEIFLSNMEEAKIVLGYKREENITIKKLLKEILHLGPKLVVITDGKEGAYGYDGVNYYKLDTFPSNRLEVTGAGDAFATGTVAGLMDGKNLAEAMRWGAANAASVIEQIGPQAGLLTLEQMRASLKENSKIIAKELK